jgi:hypothetical protein
MLSYTTFNGQKCSALLNAICFCPAITIFCYPAISHYPVSGFETGEEMDFYWYLMLFSAYRKGATSIADFLCRVIDVENYIFMIAVAHSRKFRQCFAKIFSYRRLMNLSI